MLVCSAWLIDPLTHWCLCNLEPYIWTGLWIIIRKNMQSIDWAMLPEEPGRDSSFSILPRARRRIWDHSQAFLLLEQQIEPIIMVQGVWSKGVWFTQMCRNLSKSHFIEGLQKKRKAFRFLDWAAAVLQLFFFLIKYQRSVKVASGLPSADFSLALKGLVFFFLLLAAPVTLKTESKTSVSEF